jgi:glycine/D-amino acid oxidase-like deaminating enzyme
MRSSERSESIWETSTPQREYPPLHGTVEADACIVGAGLAGITTAYLLGREGKSVIVLDHNGVGGGETGQTTAHLASANDDWFHEIERVHGADAARLVYASHDAAIERIGQIVGVEGIDCEYERVDGYWFAAPGESPDILTKELEAARRAGADVELLAAVPDMPFRSGLALRPAGPVSSSQVPARFVAGHRPRRRAHSHRQPRTECRRRQCAVRDG